MKWTSIKQQDSHSRSAAKCSGQVSNNKIAIAGQQLNKVDKYTYLDVNISKQGGGEDIHSKQNM